MFAEQIFGFLTQTENTTHELTFSEESLPQRGVGPRDEKIPQQFLRTGLLRLIGLSSVF